ncbi:MAG TPA: hypothetical protein VFA89_23375 [Terriglobales bacterium]|jgi:hypothetical protein|nr:hypothetical protein [Terriglobales bacterium]
MNPDPTQSLDQTLESAIVVSWPDLTHGAQTGLIHVEYGFAPAGMLDYLKVWSSIARGHWLLACEYWTSANNSHSTGVRFDNEYESEGLAHILEFVMQHQNSFVLPPNLGRQGLLQISTPTVEESVAAAALINEVLDRLTSKVAERTVA